MIISLKTWQKAMKICFPAFEGLDLTIWELTQIMSCFYLFHLHTFFESSGSFLFYISVTQCQLSASVLHFWNTPFGCILSCRCTLWPQVSSDSLKRRDTYLCASLVVVFCGTAHVYVFCMPICNFKLNENNACIERVQASVMKYALCVVLI